MAVHSIEEFQNESGLQFRSLDLLKEALTHRSYLNENPSWNLPHNERLEFLGDAVLELVVTEHLFKQYPDLDEGKLTSIRASLVNYVALAKSARAINMENYLLMSKGEAKDTGRAREVILANAFEALLGALYLDAGYEASSAFISKYVLIGIDEIISSDSYKDAKSYFQEQAQEKFRVTPVYKVLDESGPDHRKVFHVGVFLREKLVAEGRGYSKQEAEIDAATNGLYVFKTS
jgi:ribonuclease-3